MKNKKGFTLVELLATIVVLSLVIGITSYVVINAINSAKEKSYKVTIKELESNASNYLLENNQRLFFLTSKDNTYEYQCVTVENLVDYGYLSSDITNSKVNKDENVSIKDYIYIERDINTKSITKTIYTKTHPEYVNICSKAVIAVSDIGIVASPSFNEWSTYKNVTITYRLKNLNDQRTLDDYQFNHSYSASNEYNETTDTLENNTKTKNIKILANGKLNTSIVLGSETLASSSVTVDKIDTVGPVIAKGNYTGSAKVRHTVTIPLKVSDYGSGIDHSSFTKDDIEAMVGSTRVTNITLNKVDNSNYNLVINSDLYDGKVVIKIAKGKVLDKLKNGNEAISIDPGVTFDNTYTITYVGNGNTGGSTATTSCHYNDTCSLRGNGFSKTGYTFDGWYTASSGGSKYGGTTKLTSDIKVYAHWKINYYYLDVNGVLDGSSSGNVSGYGTFDVYINGSLVANDVADYYAQHPYGTKYQISDIRAKTGRTYNGVHSGSTNSTIGTGNASTYLRFTSNTYKITYNANGGSGAPGATTYTYSPSGSINLSGGVPSRSGYTFLGWSLSSGASSASYSAGQAWNRSNASNYTLYAVWKLNTFTITFNANGGYWMTSRGVPSAITYQYEASGCVELPQQVPNKNSYSFLGWSTNKNASSPTYRIDRYYYKQLSSYWYWGRDIETLDGCTPGNYVNNYPKNVMHDVVLYAVWRYNPPVEDEPEVTPTPADSGGDSDNGCATCYCCCSYCGGPYTCWPVGC